jgi:phage gp46-like protein
MVLSFLRSFVAGWVAFGAASALAQSMNADAVSTSFREPAAVQQAPEWAATAAMTFDLPAPDRAALLVEDAQRRELLFTDLRNGVSIPAEIHIAEYPEAWRDVARGRAWVADFSSDSAYGVRLKLAATISPGVEIWVSSDSGETTQRIDPLAAEYGEFWTTVLPGHAARLAVLVQHGTSAGDIVIRDLLYIYRDLLDPMADDFSSREGPCHTDSSCAPAWHPLRNSLGRMFSIVSNGSQSICGGTLLATQAGDFTPYFFAAQHCVDSAASAQSVVVYWFFQTSACDGAPPDIASVPTSAVADMLASRDINTGSDFAFLLLRGGLPGGLTWAGWDTSSTPPGVPVTCVHHPTGAFKRIMFGTRANHPSANFDFSIANWTSGGTTEFSTSGSPLFRDSDQKFLGQASHVLELPVGCENIDNPTGFGRFNRALAIITPFMAAGSDDPFDAAGSNDACANAAALALPATHADLVVKSVDEDWYSVVVPSCSTLNISSTFNHAFGNVDLELYADCAAAAVASSRTATNTEIIAYENRGGQATLRIRVFLASSTRNTYSLSVATTPIAGCTNCPADVNGDNVVDLSDLSVLLTHFGTPSGATRAQGDLSGDGAVNLVDLAILLSAFGTTCP